MHTRLIFIFYFYIIFRRGDVLGKSSTKRGRKQDYARKSQEKHEKAYRKSKKK